nr:retrovirus-related Pol polyprotein from transposon TNT 1-94 [Tanacetum cinerariifolium]
KTYYELLKGKKPNVSYFKVFGSLCYPTDDYDDVGKLKAKADIGIFVGYAPTKKAYRIYNKGTRKIQEIVHVTFDDLTEGLTPTHNSVGLAPNSQTSVQNSAELEISTLQSGRTRSGLVNEPSPPKIVHVTFDDLTEGLTPTHNSVGLAPNSQTSVQNSAELEISTLQSGRTRSGLVNEPSPPKFTNGSPSTTVILEDAPVITDESQTPPPDTCVVNEENLDDVDDGNIFKPYVADEEASSSNTVITPRVFGSLTSSIMSQ